MGRQNYCTTLNKYAIAILKAQSPQNEWLEQAIFDQASNSFTKEEKKLWYTWISCGFSFEKTAQILDRSRQDIEQQINNLLEKAKQ